MKLLENEYGYINPPKNDFLGAILTRDWFYLKLNDFGIYKVVDKNDERHTLGYSSLGLPQMTIKEIEGELKENTTYLCVYSKEDILNIIKQLQKIYDNMEDYEITEEKDNHCKNFLKTLINPDDAILDYERQKKEYKIAI